MKRVLIVGLLTVVLVLAMAVPAMAKNDKPKHSKMVLNVTYKISDQEQPEAAPAEGEPALAEETDGEQVNVQHRLNRHVQVWFDGEKYYVIVKDNGKWSTPPDYEPTEGQAPFDGMANGTVHGGYTAEFMGELVEGANNGNMGVIDYEGDAPGALPLTYEWLRMYFPNTYASLDLATPVEGPDPDLFCVDWAWTYMFQGQKWVNSDSACFDVLAETLDEPSLEPLEMPAEG